MRAYTHGGGGHTDNESAHFWLGKTLTNLFLCSWQGLNLGSLDLESDALPIEPPLIYRLPLQRTHHDNKILQAFTLSKRSLTSYFWLKGLVPGKLHAHDGRMLAGTTKQDKLFLFYDYEWNSTHSFPNLHWGCSHWPWPWLYHQATCVTWQALELDIIWPFFTKGVFKSPRGGGGQCNLNANKCQACQLCEKRRGKWGGAGVGWWKVLKTK